MYPITSTVKALFEAEQRQVLRVTGTDKNGVEITITDADVVMGGFNIDRYSCNGEKLEIGTAIAAEMTLKLDNRQGTFNDIVFEGTELYVEVGIADWSQEEPEVFYMPCGYFTPDEQPRSLSTITIHALDRMVKFDKTSVGMYPWTDDNGVEITDNRGATIYFVTSYALPKSVSDIISYVCSQCSVPFTQDLSELPNYDCMITEFPDLQYTITFRNIIQWCAGILGANAWIDWDGKLRFSWYDQSTGYVTTKSNRFISDVYEDDVSITGVKYTSTDGDEIISGTDVYALDMTGNYLASMQIGDILPNVGSAINGFTYRPFTATIINAPYLWPMDEITFVDSNENSHSCVITNVNFGINGSMNISGKGETLQTNSGVAPSNITSEQAFRIEQTMESISRLNSSLTQTEIFNRLTNNGEDQALILYNGKLYLNASYIQVGELSADLIKGGELTIGGETSAIIKVLNIGGDKIGEWDQTGLETNQAIIRNYIRTGPSNERILIGGISNTGYHKIEYTVNYEYVDEEVGSIESVKDETNNVRRFQISSGYLSGEEESLDLLSKHVRIKSHGSQLYTVVDIEGSLTTTGNLSAGNGASGTFTTADGKTVTVTNGIITNIA